MHFILVALLTQAAFAFDVPTLVAPVNDYANVIPSAHERQINGALRSIHSQGGSQITLLTIENLQGESIEQAAIQTVDKWKLGGKTNDNGALLLISIKDRKIRIEVGQGLEGSLTDAHSKRIIDETMVPMIKSGDLPGAILIGTYQIAKYTNPEMDVDSAFGQQRSASFDSHRKPIKIPGIVYLVFLVMFMMLGRRGLLGFLLGSALGRSGRFGGGRFGGGGFGGGGFGGGGGGSWSGGGGGFSGGGASGGW